MQRRLNLVDLVLSQGYSIVRASKKLELKPYTAASILNKFKEKGVIFDHKLKKYIKPEPSNSPLT
jgi:transposase